MKYTAYETAVLVWAAFGIRFAVWLAAECWRTRRRYQPRHLAEGRVTWPERLRAHRLVTRKVRELAAKYSVPRDDPTPTSPAPVYDRAIGSPQYLRLRPRVLDANVDELFADLTARVQFADVDDEAWQLVKSGA